MSDLDKIVGEVRAALTHPPRQANHESNGAAPPPQSALHQLELVSQFAHELERVGGKFGGSVSADALGKQLVQLTRDLALKRIALAEGVTVDSGRLAETLASADREIIRTVSANNEGERAAFRAKLAACDFGIIEADYAIASTGTFCIVAGGRRPSSLTILPPINFIFVSTERILPSLAEVIAAVGPERFRSNRVALITGPSRTADIEKMIVIGVHGPKQLYAAAVTS